MLNMLLVEIHLKLDHSIQENVLYLPILLKKKHSHFKIFWKKKSSILIWRLIYF